VGEQWLDCKPGRDVHVGDLLRITINSISRDLMVRAVSSTRGPATVAQQLYEETAESVT
jgi:ribosome-associated heat shock protein Hsp15